jgi:hypothetical protein
MLNPNRSLLVHGASLDFTIAFLRPYTTNRYMYSAAIPFVQSFPSGKIVYAPGWCMPQRLSDDSGRHASRIGESLHLAS